MQRTRFLQGLCAGVTTVAMTTALLLVPGMTPRALADGPTKLTPPVSALQKAKAPMAPSSNQHDPLAGERWLQGMRQGFGQTAAQTAPAPRNMGGAAPLQALGKSATTGVNPPGEAWNQAKSLPTVPTVGYPAAISRTPGALQQSPSGPRMSARSLAAPAGPLPDAPVNQWQSVGPAPITGMDLEGMAAQYNSDAAGRISSLAVSNNGKVIYVGTAGGGVWRSVNGGQSWKPLTDDQASLAMGGLAVQWNADWHQNVIYAGTGEFHHAIDSMYGMGILKSTDGGDTWTTLHPPDFAGCAHGAMAVGSDGILFAGGSCGLYFSTDGGQHWTWPNLHMEVVIYDLKVASTSTGYALYAATQAGLFEYDSGTDPTQASSWTFLSDFPQAVALLNAQQTKLAVPSAGAIYAAVSLGNHHDALYIYHNGTWQTQPLGDIYDEHFLDVGSSYDMGWYANALAVDPTNPNHIWVGGTGLIESRNGGNTWSADKAKPQGIHVDFHDMAYDGLGNLYTASDGGIWKLGKDGKVTNLNHNLAITQVYPGLSQYDNGARIAAGTQDNGFFLRKNGVSREMAHGDGTVTLIDPTNPNVVWAQYPSGYLMVSKDGGKTFGDFVDVGDGDTQWLAPLVMDPTNPNVIYQGRDRRVVVSYDGANTKPGMYNPAHPELGGSWHELGDLHGQANDYPQALAVAPSDPRVIYAGLADGALFMTEDGGGHWRPIYQGDSVVTGVAVSPTNPYTVYMTGNGKHAYGSYDPSPGVNRVEGMLFKTTNAFDTNPIWYWLADGLPSAATNTVALAGNTVVVGTDVGVFTLDEATGQWYGLGSGLPNAQVLDLKVSPQGTIFAATHGRGVWTLQGGAPVATPTITNIQASATADPGTVTLSIYGTNFVGVTSLLVAGRFVDSYTVVSPTEIQARILSLVGSGHVPVWVEAAGGTSPLTPLAYYYFGSVNPTYTGAPFGIVSHSGTVTAQVAGLPANTGIQVECVGSSFNDDCSTADVQNVQWDLHLLDSGTYGGTITFDFSADTFDFFYLDIYGGDWALPTFEVVGILPAVTAVNPTNVAVGVPITLTGLGFGAADERFYERPALHEVHVWSVEFDTDVSLPVTSWSDTQVVVTLPDNPLPCGPAVLQAYREFVATGVVGRSEPFHINITSGANGCGTATVSPGTLTAGQTGKVLTFTYSVPEALYNGAVAIALPSSLWATPTTVTSAVYATADKGNVTVAPIASLFGSALVLPGAEGDQGTGIFVEGVTLAAGEPLTITYGGPGLVVPNVVGPHPFRVYQSREQADLGGGPFWAEYPLVTTPVVNVVPDQPASFGLSAAVSTVTVGDAIYLEVAAKDAEGNTVTTYTGTVHFTSTDSQAELPADYQFKPADLGRKTFVLGLNTAGTQRITVRDKVIASLSGTSVAFMVNPPGSGGGPVTPPAPTTTTTTQTTSTGIEQVTVTTTGSSASTNATGNQGLNISAGGGAVGLQMDPGTIPATGGSSGGAAPQFNLSLQVVSPSDLPGFGGNQPSDLKPQAAVEIRVFLVQGGSSGSTTGGGSSSGSDNATSGTDVHQLAKPVTISFTIPPQQIAQAQQVVVAYYNTTLGIWIQLPATVDPVTGKVTLTVDHFTQFAVFTSAGSTNKLVSLPKGEVKSGLVSVNGQSDAGTKITVYNNGVVASSQTMTGKGSWSLPVSLVDGRNSLVVVATQNGGSIGLGESVVTYQAPAAPSTPTPALDPDAVAVDTSAGPATVTSKDQSAAFTFAAGSLAAGATAKLTRDATLPVLLPLNTAPASPVWTINASAAVGHPVTATLHFQLPPGATADQVGLYRLTFGRWEFYGGASKVDPAASTVTATLPHLGTWALLVNTRSFADLTPDFWGYRPILALNAAGIMGGLPDGSFQPNRATTRAEFLRMLLNTMGVAPQAAEKSPFADVAADAWYAGYLNAAYEKGLLRGTDGLARPDQTITRQEVAVMLDRAISLARLPAGGNVPVDLKSPYTDREEIAPWALAATTTVRLHGFMRGYPDGTFGPNQTLTRAEAAVIMVQFLQKIQTPTTHLPE